MSKNNLNSIRILKENVGNECSCARMGSAIMEKQKEWMLTFEVKVIQYVMNVSVSGDRDQNGFGPVMLHQRSETIANSKCVNGLPCFRDKEIENLRYGYRIEQGNFGLMAEEI